MVREFFRVFVESKKAAKLPETRPSIWNVTGQVLVPKMSPTVVLANTRNSRSLVRAQNFRKNSPAIA